jgi:redox-sensitive bicupin YhaK (pirin superfamily)
MIKIRKSKDRGQARHGWLNSSHTFSFADYFDPKHMGYSVLRVINEDLIDGGTGFETHGHKDMEIISYVIDGALEHKDSMDTTAIIRPGEVQRMSAGTGIRHSEKNHLKDKKTHFLQIWIKPEKEGVEPGYEQKSFSTDFGSSNMILVASRNGKNNSIKINQDVDMYVAKLEDAGENIFKTSKHRHTWIQVIKGELKVEGVPLNAGDGAAIDEVDIMKLQWSKDSEFIIFDLP